MISVICPVYNDLEGLETTINSLLQQDFEDYEIIIGDNNSTDGTKEKAIEYANNHDNVKVTIEREVQTSYANRNTAIKEASGDIVAFIDADMHVYPNWLRLIDDYFKSHNVDYIGCNVHIYANENNIFSQYNITTGFPIRKYIEEEHFAPTCCLVVRKKVFNNVGVFNPSMVSSGDKEFGERCYSHGFKQTFAENILMFHPARCTFKELKKKSFRIGRGFYQHEFYSNVERLRTPSTNPIKIISNNQLPLRLFVVHVVLYFYAWLGYYKEKRNNK